MLNHKGTGEIKTERLLLRRFREGDAEAMYRNYTSDPEVTKYLMWQAHPSVETTEGYLASILPKYESPETYRWAIEYGGEVIGAIDAVDLSTKHEHCEIGYCMGKAWWNRGIMTEALKAVIDYMFTVPGFHCVHARHDILNVGSGRVMAKAGMAYEGLLRDRHKSGGGDYRSLASYSILKDEYLEKK